MLISIRKLTGARRRLEPNRSVTIADRSPASFDGITRRRVAMPSQAFGAGLPYMRPSPQQGRCIPRADAEDVHAVRSEPKAAGGRDQTAETVVVPKWRYIVPQIVIARTTFDPEPSAEHLRSGRFAFSGLSDRTGKVTPLLGHEG